MNQELNRPCRKCGDQVPDSSNHCPSCGRGYSDVEAKKELVEPGAQLVRVVFDGWNLKGANLQEATLNGASFESSVLDESDLDRASLIGAWFEGASLVGATLTNTLLRGSLFIKADLRRVRLDGADHPEKAREVTCGELVEVAAEGQAEKWFPKKKVAPDVHLNDRLPVPASPLDYEMARPIYSGIQGAVFHDSDMRDASARAAYFERAHFRRANMEGADLSGARLTGSVLDSVCLRNATLRYSGLSECSIRDADLTSANLQGTFFYRSDLSNSSLKGADLTGARLTDANLTNVDFSGAIFEGAEFQDSNYEEARLTTAQLGTIKAAINDVVEESRAQKANYKRFNDEMMEKHRLDESTAAETVPTAQSLADSRSGFPYLVGVMHLDIRAQFNSFIEKEAPYPKDKVAIANSREWLSSMARRFHQDAGSGRRFDSWCWRFAETAKKEGVLHDFEGRERFYFDQTCAIVFEETVDREFADTVIGPIGLPPKLR